MSARIAPNSHIIWGARIEKDLPKNSLRVLVVIAGAKLPQYDVETTLGEDPLGGELDDGIVDIDIID
ncbi:MAG: hypothetical protein ABIF01_05835 [Candidatus Micrarchaeota archaeon]